MSLPLEAGSISLDSLITSGGELSTRGEYNAVSEYGGHEGGAVMCSQQSKGTNED